MNPNTIRAVYRRLSDAGYVTSRHGAGTHVAERPPQRRGAEALAGIVAEMLRRAAHAGFTADELAAATFAAATERKRPGPHVRVLYAECTNADAGYDAERLVDEFGGIIEAEGALLDDLPDRLERFHYDLVATTTFHADEAQALVAGRVPVVAMIVGPGYVELVHEIAELPAGSRVGLVCASWRGADNIRETLALSGHDRRRDRVGAHRTSPRTSTLIDQTADIILMSREALAAGLDRASRGPSGSGRGPTSSTRPAWSCSAAPSSTSPRAAAARPHGRPDLPRDARRCRPDRRAMLRRCAPATSTSAANRASVTRSTRRCRRAAATSSSRDLAGIRRLAARMNAARPAGAPSVRAGEIGALGLLHEVGHLLIARYEADAGRARWRPRCATSEAGSAPTPTACSTASASEFPGAGPEPEPRPTGSRSCS